MDAEGFREVVLAHLKDGAGAQSGRDVGVVGWFHAGAEHVPAGLAGLLGLHIVTPSGGTPPPAAWMPYAAYLSSCRSASSGRAPSHRSDDRHETGDDDCQDHQDDQQRGESGQSSAGCQRQQGQSYSRFRWLKGVKVASEPFLEKAAQVFKLVIATTITHQKIRKPTGNLWASHHQGGETTGPAQTPAVPPAGPGGRGDALRSALSLRSR